MVLVPSPERPTGRRVRNRTDTGPAIRHGRTDLLVGERSTRRRAAARSALRRQWHVRPTLVLGRLLPTRVHPRRAQLRARLADPHAGCRRRVRALADRDGVLRYSDAGRGGALLRTADGHTSDRDRQRPRMGDPIARSGADGPPDGCRVDAVPRSSRALQRARAGGSSGGLQPGYRGRSAAAGRRGRHHPRGRHRARHRAGRGRPRLAAPGECADLVVAPDPTRPRQSAGPQPGDSERIAGRAARRRRAAPGRPGAGPCDRTNDCGRPAAGRADHGRRVHGLEQPRSQAPDLGATRRHGDDAQR